MFGLLGCVLFPLHVERVRVRLLFIKRIFNHHVLLSSIMKLIISSCLPSPAPLERGRG
jgi:hypothetical protein